MGFTRRVSTLKLDLLWTTWRHPLGQRYHYSPFLVSHSYTFLKPDVDRFIPNMTTLDNRLEIRRNWDLLMPCKIISLHIMIPKGHTNLGMTVGSGSVAIPEYKDHPLLGDPIVDDPIRSGPLYEASWTHALHCVSTPSLVTRIPIPTRLLTPLIALLRSRQLPPIDRQRPHRQRQP